MQRDATEKIQRASEYLRGPQRTGLPRENRTPKKIKDRLRPEAETTYVRQYLPGSSYYSNTQTRHKRKRRRLS